MLFQRLRQPLLGAVDTAVIGRLDNPAYVGGVAIGTVIFNTMYWLFGFLRVSTSGFSAQALGSQSEKDSYLAYFRPVLVALVVSALFLLFQKPLIEGAFALYEPETVVYESAKCYFSILIWGAPFVLVGYVNLGWIMGQKRIKETMILQISMNLLNVLLCLFLALYCDMGVAGVAYATLIAQCYGFILGLWFIAQRISLTQWLRFKEELFNKKELKNIMSVNADLMIRTMCLLIMTNMFVAQGNRFGVEILAANTILFQIQYIMCYLYDGFANASSIFAGRAIGAKDYVAYKETLYISNVMAGVLSILLAVILVVAYQPIIMLFTDIPNVIAISIDYIGWMILFPFTIGIGLVYYGIFTGATYTKPIRNSMIYALLGFLVIFFSVVPYWGNHGLWCAFIIFSMIRSVFLYKDASVLEKHYFHTRSL